METRPTVDQIAYVAQMLMRWMALEHLARHGVDDTIGFVVSQFGNRAGGGPDPDGVVRGYRLRGRTAIYRERLPGSDVTGRGTTERRVPLRAVVRFADGLLTDADRAQLRALVKLRGDALHGRTIPDPTRRAAGSTPPRQIRAGGREQVAAERALRDLEHAIHARTPAGQLALIEEKAP